MVQHNQRKKVPYISRKSLARLYGLNPREVFFAVEEVLSEECVFEFIPVLLSTNGNFFINMLTAEKEPVARISGNKPNFYLASIFFDAEKDAFLFIAGEKKARPLAVKELLKNYGKSVILC
jgi:hypothetical protein